MSRFLLNITDRRTDGRTDGHTRPTDIAPYRVTCARSQICIFKIMFLHMAFFLSIIYHIFSHVIISAIAKDTCHVKRVENVIAKTTERFICFTVIFR